MEVKMMAAVVAVGNGQDLNVARFCREQAVSAKTFYKWVNRYKADGLDGLVDRSRRPRSNPNQTPVEIEEQIVRLRKQLADVGLDNGAITIQCHLGRRGVARVPAVSTIHRILVERGLVIPAPKKRPKRAWTRFEAPGPNELWQTDATDWGIEAGLVKVLSMLDDHSRVALRCRAVPEATTDQAWLTFCEAAQRWGLPAGVLSDNGLCFSGKLRGFEVAFEANLRDAGVKPITGRPYHPQTTGKVERFQQTLKKWLRKQTLANSLAELQTQLDTFCAIYNNDRPHQGIGRQTPISRWRATPSAGPALEPLPHPEYGHTRNTTVTIAANGHVAAGRRYRIGIGSKWAGQQALVIADDHHANVFINGQLIRHLELDPTRKYQPLKPRTSHPLP